MEQDCPSRQSCILFFRGRVFHAMVIIAYLMKTDGWVSWQNFLVGSTVPGGAITPQAVELQQASWPAHQVWSPFAGPLPSLVESPVPDPEMNTVCDTPDISQPPSPGPGIPRTYNPDTEPVPS